MIKVEFKNIEEFKKHLKIEGKAGDIIKIDNKIFTIESYDDEGKEIVYGNKKYNLGLIVRTEDRYKYKYKKGLEVFYEENKDYFRDDINYIE